MALINMDFNGRSVPDKISKARGYIKNITNNAYFPTPNPALDTLTQAVNNLETAYLTAQDGGKASKVEQDLRETELDKLISTLSAYIQSESGGDETKIRSTGAEIRKDAVPIGALPAPKGLLAKISTIEGSVDCKWEKVQGAKSYIIQLADDLTGAKWNYAASSTSARYTIGSLESGKKYLFRVSALGAAGPSPWSDPAVGMAG